MLPTRISEEPLTFKPPYSPPVRRETLPGPVDVGFHDRAGRKRSRSYGEDSRPSEKPQMQGLAAAQ